MTERRQVCLVTEYAKGRPEGYLYGVFTTEEAARRAYGEPSMDWRVTFEMFPLFGGDDHVAG